MRTIFLVGPTAVGKSAVALALARRLAAGGPGRAAIPAEIVSADSMQVYRGMDIGTAKPTGAERSAVPHHLIDLCEVNQAFDVKQYVESAKRIIADIHRRGRAVLVVGGTGLYVRALRHGLFEGPGRDPALRTRLEQMTAAALFEELQRVDPVTSARIDRHNPRRLVRALEVFYASGRPIAEQQTQWARGENLDFRPQTTDHGPQTADHGPRTTDHGPRVSGAGPAFCLNRPRAELYARIERRIDAQIAAGWVEEVRRLLAVGLEHNVTALQAAGYRELAAYVRGELAMAEAVARIKTRTRQLARRQLTWFRREPDLVWVEMEADELAETAAQEIIQQLRGPHPATHTPTQARPEASR